MTQASLSGSLRLGNRAGGWPMLNWIWLSLILLAVIYAGFTGSMEAVYRASFESASKAVQDVIKLAGFMIFMLGLMRVARDAGLLLRIARWLQPLMRRLFPDVPTDHPAMGAMVMNMASNMLGMGNAATPFGLKAMAELNRLNAHPGIASDAMVLFLAINTSAITLMAPTGTMSVRDAVGSASPAAIWIPTLMATTCSTIAAVSAYFLLRRRRRYSVEFAVETAGPEADGASDFQDVTEDVDIGPEAQPMGTARALLVGGVALVLLVALGLEVFTLVTEQGAIEALKEISGSWLIPLLVVGLLLVGVAGRVRVYESMVAGAREGLDVVVRILPFFLVILVAVGMFRASGVLDLIISLLNPATSLIGFPGEALPMALLRPLSGSGAFAVMAETLEIYGPDSFIGMLTSTLQGSTETTFYVLTIYCGAAGVRNVRHALAVCLIGDLGGFLGATAACHLFFG